MYVLAFLTLSFCPLVYHLLISYRWKRNSGNFVSGKRGGVFPQSHTLSVACQAAHLTVWWHFTENAFTHTPRNSVTRANHYFLYLRWAGLCHWMTTAMLICVYRKLSHESHLALIYQKWHRQRKDRKQTWRTVTVPVHMEGSEKIPDVSSTASETRKVSLNWKLYSHVRKSSYYLISSLKMCKISQEVTLLLRKID